VSRKLACSPATHADRRPIHANDYVALRRRRAGPVAHLARELGGRVGQKRAGLVRHGPDLGILLESTDAQDDLGAAVVLAELRVLG